MEVMSFILGFLFSVIFLPICFIIIVSIRRSILDGSYIDNIPSKYILITGCDSGFGFALAKQLDSIGCHVIATCLTKEGEDRLKAVVSSRMNILLMDVTMMESIEAAEKRVREILPSADALWGIVNNAGIIHYAPIFDFETLESMKQVSDVNLWGTVAVTKVFLPYLKKSKGRIVNVCSTAGRCGMPGRTGYAISKFGISAFSDCIRLELSLFGISVHIIEPGGFVTEMSSLEKTIDDLKYYWNQAPEERRMEYGQEWLDDRIAFVTKCDKKLCPRVDLLVSCIEHSLLSRNPKKRYFPGPNSSQFIWWLSLLPADISDRVIHRINPLPKPLKAVT